MPGLKPLCLYLASLAAVGQLVPLSYPQKTERLIDRVYVDSNCVVHIVEHSGSDKSIPKEKDQVGTDMVKIAEDRKTAGWTAEYPNCCTSYPIPLVLVIYRDGRVRHRLGDGMMIYDWKFRQGGRQIAFCSGTVHGPTTHHCELHDARTGRTLATVDRAWQDSGTEDKYPPWARRLQH